MGDTIATQLATAVLSLAFTAATTVALTSPADLVIMLLLTMTTLFAIARAMLLLFIFFRQWHPVLVKLHKVNIIAFKGHSMSHRLIELQFQFLLASRVIGDFQRWFGQLIASEASRNADDAVDTPEAR